MRRGAALGDHSGHRRGARTSRDARRANARANSRALLRLAPTALLLLVREQRPVAGIRLRFQLQPAEAITELVIDSRAHYVYMQSVLLQSYDFLVLSTVQHVFSSLGICFFY